MAAISATSPSCDGRIAVFTGGVTASGADHAYRVAVEESNHVLDDLRVGTAVILLGHVADMRRQQDVGRAPQRVIGGQRLTVVNVEGSVTEPTGLQGFDHRIGVDNRPARRVDED